MKKKTKNILIGIGLIGLSWIFTKITVSDPNDGMAVWYGLAAIISGLTGLFVVAANTII